MDCSIDVKAREIDSRSSQFACELTVLNNGDDPIEVIATNLRPPRGIEHDAANDLSDVELARQHAEMCGRIRKMVSRYLSRAVSEHEPSRKGFRELIKTSEISLEREKFLSLPVSSANEAEKVVKIVREHIPGDVMPAAFDHYLASLRDIESHEAFRTSRCARARLARGQSYKATFMVRARRRGMNLASYCINLDVELQTPDGKSHLLRSESVPITVTPNAWLLTGVALAASFLGVIVSLVTERELGSKGITFAGLGDALVGAIPMFAVAAITAAIVFNVYDFTSLRERFETTVTWRGAMLIGFICGYLNERVLEAIKALLG